MPKYPGISPYDNEKGDLGSAKKRWNKLYVKEIESDTVSGINATIENLATTAENSVSAAVSAKNDAVSAKQAAEAAQTAAETAAAGIQSVVETDVDNTLSIAGVAADAKVTGDWLRDIAKPVTLNTSLPATVYAEEYMKVTTDSEGRVLYGVKRDGTFTWQKGVPKHLQDKITPTINNDEYIYVMLDGEGRVLFGVKKDGSFDWQKGLPKPVKEKLEEVAQTVIDSEEFVQLTRDADGKLIEGVTADGVKKFMSPVVFSSNVRISDEGIKDISRRMKNGPFNYENYIRHIVGSSPYYTGLNVLYLEGDMTGISKDDKVNLTYTYLGQSGTCTLKWQGQGSLLVPKKNYSIAKMTPKLDIGYGLQAKYTLKGYFTDYSHARDLTSAKVWGDIVKSRTPANNRLSALVNGGAVDGFPIMLVINGEYQGLYCFNIPKDKWLFDMGSGEYEAILSAERVCESTRFRATVTREVFLSESDWEAEYLPDEDDPDWAIDSLNRMITAAINSSGANYRETLQNYLDIESAIDYYIFTCLTGNLDGIAKNFLLCTYDGTKWFFSAYDMDWTFGAAQFGSAYVDPRTGISFASVASSSRVFYLIYTYDKTALKARYNVLRNSALSEENVAKLAIRLLLPVPKAVMDEEAVLWSETMGTTTNNLESIINWYRLRVKYLDEQIQNM